MRSATALPEAYERALARRTAGQPAQGRPSRPARADRSQYESPAVAKRSRPARPSGPDAPTEVLDTGLEIEGRGRARTRAPRPAAGGQRPLRRERGSRSTHAAAPREPRRRSDSVVSTSLERKLDERRSQRHRRTWRLWGFLLGCALVFGALTWAVAFSPLFALHGDAIKVTGATAPVDPAAIAKVARSQVSRPLPRINTATLAEQVETSQPWVKAAEVTRNYPHGITVAVTMREAVARNGDATDTLVADDGALVPAAGLSAKGLPALDTPEGRSAADARAAGAYVSSLLNKEVRARVARISVAENMHMRLTLDSGSVVRWGNMDDSELKARVMETLIAKEAKVYDLTDPVNPTTR